MLSDGKKAEFRQKILDFIRIKQNMEPSIGVPGLEQEINLLRKYYETFPEKERSDLEVVIREIVNFVPELNDTMLGICDNFKVTDDLKTRFLLAGSSSDFHKRVQSYIRIGHFLGLRGNIKVPITYPSIEEIFYVDVDLTSSSLDKVSIWMLMAISRYLEVVKKEDLKKVFLQLKEVFEFTHESKQQKRRYEDILAERCKENKMTYIPIRIYDDENNFYEAGVIYFDGFILFSPAKGLYGYDLPETLLFKIAPRFLNEGVLSEHGMVLLRGLFHCHVDTYMDKLHQLVLTSAQLTNSTSKTRKQAFIDNSITKFENTDDEKEYDITINTVLGLMRGAMFLIESKGEVSNAIGSLQSKCFFAITKFHNHMKNQAIEDLIGLFKKQSMYKEHYLNRIDIAKLLCEQQYGQHVDLKQAEYQQKRLVRLLSSVNYIKRSKIIPHIPESVREEIVLDLTENFSFKPLSNESQYSDEEFFKLHSHILTKQDLDLEWERIETKMEYCVFYNKYSDATVYMVNHEYGCAFHPVKFSKEEIKFSLQKTMQINKEKMLINLDDEAKLRAILDGFYELRNKNFYLGELSQGLIESNSELNSIYNAINAL